VTWRASGSDTSVVALPTTATDARVLLLDNYDSFTYNLAHYAEQLGARVTVIRNDARTVDDLAAEFAAGAFTHLILSPGPGGPEDAGVSTALVRRIGNRVPILGICLGHQCIAEAYGSRTIRARQPVHGKPALVHHDGHGVYTGINGPLVAARYHSLVVDRIPEDLQVTAQTADGTVMGVRHRHHRVEGIQVHPESILTPWGHTMIANFLIARS
jgi:para-aminobenzoate synthetase/4-amino-4-deoxychorismate lyase